MKTKIGLNVEKDFFGTINNKDIYLYTLKNVNGILVNITNYGGIITSLITPDKNNQLEDIVLGYDNLQSYLANPAYFGAIVGRYANRIAKGKFILSGKTYTLATNNNGNHLHGGIKGFDKAIWNAKGFKKTKQVGVLLTYLSKDKEEGYPGNLFVKTTYYLNNENELHIEFKAETDKATPINLTNHSYFNLKGAGNGDILNHQIMINADRFTPIDKSLIPTGELRRVNKTPLDFNLLRTIGERIDEKDEQLILAGGYDHNFILNSNKNQINLAARVYEPGSGRTMEIHTTQPAVQFYTGNFLDGLVGKGNKVYNKRFGFCLETQHFPDSPNHPNFSSTILNPNKVYKQKTIIKFISNRHSSP